MAALTGAERAAIVILSLREDAAVALLKQLPDKDVQCLARAVEHLDPLPEGALAPTLRQFEDALGDPLILPPGAQYLRRLASSALGEERADRLLQAAPPVPVMPSSVNDLLARVNPQTIASLLRKEHPQIAGVLLTQMTPQRAAEVLARLDEQTQAELVTRAAKLKELPKGMLQMIAESFLAPLSSAQDLHTSPEASEFDGMQFVAQLVNALPGEASERLLELLEGREDNIAASIREAMFTFEDLGRLDRKALQVLMREVSSDQLLLALRSAGESIRESFFGAVSERAAAGMREELEYMSPKRLSEVEAAQRAIVDTAVRLSTEGRIEGLGASSDDMV